MKKLLCKTERASVTGRSLFRFSVCAHIRHCSSLSQFKISPRTGLFTSAYSELHYPSHRLWMLYLNCLLLLLLSVLLLFFAADAFIS